MRHHMTGVLAVIALLLIVAFAPGDEPPNENFDAFRVNRAITPQLTAAVCGPYSDLDIFEDGTYTCSPG